MRLSLHKIGSATSPDVSGEGSGTLEAPLRLEDN